MPPATFPMPGTPRAVAIPSSPLNASIISQRSWGTPRAIFCHDSSGAFVQPAMTPSRSSASECGNNCNCISTSVVPRNQNAGAIEAFVEDSMCNDSQQHFGRFDIPEALVAVLYNWLCAVPVSPNPTIPAPMPPCSTTEAVQLSILTNSLALVLVSSRNKLQPAIQTYGADLVLSLHRLAIDFGSWNGNRAVQEVVLGNVMRSVRSIRPYVPHASEALLDALKIIMKSPISNDIRVATAIAFTEFFDDTGSGSTGSCSRRQQGRLQNGQHQQYRHHEHDHDRQSHRHHHHHNPNVEGDCSVLISTLSVAAVFADDVRKTAILKCFAKIVARSSQLRAKVARRRCAVMAVIRLLDDPDILTRRRALLVLGRILNDAGASIALLTGTSGNLALIVNKLEYRLGNETEPKLRCSIIRTLRDAYSVGTGVDLSFANRLVSIYQLSKDPKVAKAAAGTFCKIIQTPCEDVHLYLHIVHLLQHSNDSIRTRALKCMEEVASSPKVSFFFLTETNAMERLLSIIDQGKDMAKVRAMNIFRLWSQHECNQRDLCTNQPFLDTIVDMTVQQKSVADPVVHLYSTKIISALFASDDNIEYLLDYPQLLPWLVLHSARPKSERLIQSDLTTITVRLSKLMLSTETRMC